MFKDQNSNRKNASCVSTCRAFLKPSFIWTVYIWTSLYLNSMYLNVPSAFFLEICCWEQDSPPRPQFSPSSSPHPLSPSSKVVTCTLKPIHPVALWTRGLFLPQVCFITVKCLKTPARDLKDWEQDREVTGRFDHLPIWLRTSRFDHYPDLSTVQHLQPLVSVDLTTAPSGLDHRVQKLPSSVMSHSMFVVCKNETTLFFKLIVTKEICLMQRLVKPHVYPLVRLPACGVCRDLFRGIKSCSPLNVKIRRRLFSDRVFSASL